MTQGEVLKILEKSDKWMSVADIRKKLKKGRGCIGANLTRLFNQGFVVRRGSKARHCFEYEYMVCH